MTSQATAGQVLWRDVPASSRAAVSEARDALRQSQTARWLRDEGGFVVFEVQPGRFHFIGDGSTR